VGSAANGKAKAKAKAKRRWPNALANVLTEFCYVCKFIAPTAVARISLLAGNACVVLS